MRVSVLAICCLALAAHSAAVGHERSLKQALQFPAIPGFPNLGGGFPITPAPNPPAPAPGPAPAPAPAPGPVPPPPGGSSIDTQATVPVSKTRAPWDFTASGQLGRSASAVWSQLSASPKRVIEAGFRHLAFRVVDFGNGFQVFLNSAQDMVFTPTQRSQNGKFWIFDITRHSLQIFNIADTFVDIQGSEIYFQLSGSGNAVLTVGMKASVRPPGPIERAVKIFLEGFLESMVDHFRMEFGAGGCTTNREVAGICNNPNPLWGSANIPLRRLSRNDPAFADGVKSPSGPTSISARLISNICGTQGSTADDASNKMRLTDMFVFFGQFIDHDVGISPIATFAVDKQPLFTSSTALFTELFSIRIPQNDPVFTGPNRKEALTFERTVHERRGGEEVRPRKLLNSITSYLDLGQVYGSEAVRRRALRSFQGGKLKTGGGNFLPFNGGGAGGVGITLENAPNAQSRFYVAGDIRACENANLVSFHTIWMREHNRVAGEIAAVMGGLSDETLFRYARDVVIAEYQSIIYSEWLPKLLGSGAPSPSAYRYNSGVDPTMSAFFTTVAFRFGHTMVNNFFWRMSANSNTPYSRVPLRDVFFKPEVITASTMDDFVRGMSKHQAREVDMKVVDDIRSFLFTDNGGPEMDLLSLNIQRGRDMGLPSYNNARSAFGLSPASSFASITSNAAEQAQLSLAYNGNVNLVDPFIGGLAEDAPPGRLFGDLFQSSLTDQFRRLRDGDRMFYKGFPFPAELTSKYSRINLIKNDQVKMGDIIARNTNIQKSDLQGTRASVFQL